MSVQEQPEVIRVVFAADLIPGQPLQIEKFVTYHQSGTRFAGELMFRVQQTLDRAREIGADAVFAEHEAVVRDFWRDADVELEGAPGLQCALRFNLFHLLQATCLAEGHGVPAKGLTGEGYEGHYFWDIEMYVVPFLVYTRPLLARSLLLQRYHQLPQARKRAQEVGQRGALYPWRTISGEDASAFYAAGTAQYHINADIAFMIRKYVQMTGDREFLERYGAEMLVETARLWVDLGFFSERKKGRFVINGVTGPDEYTTVVDNNAFTNLMARENLRMAAAVVEDLQQHSQEHYDRLVAATNVAPTEVELWRRAADAMYVPYDQQARVHLQDDSFLDLKPWDFEGTAPEKYPLLLHFHPLFIYRHQVIKQPDMLLAAFLLDQEFTEADKRRIFDYYDPITTGDSSLSECIEAIVACAVGEVGAAHRYLLDSAVVDLADRNLNVRDGVHLASCAGTWMAMVNGFAGMRDTDGELSFRPSLPPHWGRVRFRVRVRGSLLELELRQGETRYRLIEGPPLSVRHVEESFLLEPGRERVFAIPIARTSVLPREAYQQLGA
jgi:alpha,alpha-trehalose phosphorylase